MRGGEGLTKVGQPTTTPRSEPPRRESRQEPRPEPRQETRAEPVRTPRGNVAVPRQNGRQPAPAPRVERPHAPLSHAPEPLVTPPSLLDLESIDGEESEHRDSTGVVLEFRPLASPRPTAIPPREHTERERLAMRPEIRGDLGLLIDDLHALFERHLTVAKQASSARCGICYLHFPTAELEYREADGFYVCPACNQDLRGQPLPMIRRQPR
jgi:hypothetical protein